MSGIVPPLKMRLRHYIERHDLRRIMNDTKWREATEFIRSLEPSFPVIFRFKSVRDSPPSSWNSVFWEHGPQWFMDVEWLDIQTIVTIPGGLRNADRRFDRTEEIIAAFRSHHIPFSYAEGVIRIWDYLRPGSEPASDEARDNPVLTR